MMYAIIAAVSIVASFLTFFSGFGLGTLLLPVFSVFYPLHIAVALTAVVHLLNNLFKMTLVFRNIDWKVVLHFGLPSMLAAFAGAFLLKNISNNDLVLGTYQLMGHEFSVTLPGIVIGSLIILFSFFELSKKLSELSFDKKYMLPGGLLSGFFGGLSGHQGALRSAFLLRLGLEKQNFIASGVMIACLVDLVRLSLYSRFDALKENEVDYALLATAILSAWVGAFAGNKLFKKTSIDFFKWLVGGFMLLMGVLIGVGIIA